jgi:nitrate reductase gamma subunit
VGGCQFPGYDANTSYGPQLWWWLPSNVLHAQILVWVYNNTDRSILAVLLMHSPMNLTGDFLGLADEMFPFQLPSLVLVVVVLVASGRLSKTSVVRKSEEESRQTA